MWRGLSRCCVVSACITVKVCNVLWDVFLADVGCEERGGFPGTRVCEGGSRCCVKVLHIPVEVYNVSWVSLCLGRPTYS